MHTKWVFSHFSIGSKLHIRMLFMLWFAGLTVGILMCKLCPDAFVSTMCNALHISPSPYGLLLAGILPVAVTAILLITSLYWLLYPMVFLRAVCLGFSAILIYIAQGSCAWLLRPMLLFSASCASVLMWWLLLTGNNKICLFRGIRFAAFLSCLMFIVDCFVIQPLFDDLSKYF